MFSLFVLRLNEHNFKKNFSMIIRAVRQKTLKTINCAHTYLYLYAVYLISAQKLTIYHNTYFFNYQTIRWQLEQIEILHRHY